MTLHRLMRNGYVLALAAILAAGAAGAAPPPAASAPPLPSIAEGLYGPPTGKLTPVVRARMMNPAPPEWRKAPFICFQTDLSPATLYYSSTKYLAFFANMKEAGLGGPTHIALMSAGNPRVVKAGAAVDPAAMGECWVLAWFAGAEGWTDWDSPWVVYLQRRPSRITFDAAGLAFRFDGPAGYAVLMPLYGYLKPPQQGKDFLAAGGLPSANIRPWEWAGGLPADVLARVRYWANVSREFPVYCEDSFSIDRSRDAVVIRQRFDWIAIDDDWKTPHLKLAPLSPVLALAVRDGKFPVTFSRPVVDPQLFTPYGPYMGVEGADTFDATFHVLQYVHEMEAYDRPAPGAPAVAAAAQERLLKTARGKFRSPDRYSYDHGDKPGALHNFCWAIMGDQWYARGLPYYDDATQAIARESLKKYFHEDVLVAARFKEREYPRDSGQTYYILEGPGIGSWNVLGDAGKFSTNLLETLWAYAHFTGDWGLLRERWATVPKLFCTPAETTWATFGRHSIAELGDEAPPCLALARMAYRTGDMNTYGYACYAFARELVMHWVKQRGAPYYRARQPWHTMEFMPEEVYLTNLWGGTAGWQIDGPDWPANGKERQFKNRWVRFHSEEVGRFYREFLAADVRREMDLLTGRLGEERRWQSNSHTMPSQVQLRSLLLNEKPEALAKLATPDQFKGPASGVIASCISVLRTSHPTRYERLIPAGPATPFVPGLEREKVEPGRHLAQVVLTEIPPPRQRGAKNGPPAEPQIVWPTVTWRFWQTPAGKPWTFGQVVPVPAGVPIEITKAPLNWNTEAVAYTLP